MTGTYEHNIDAKGRLFIPARLRDELGDVFHVAIGAGGFLTIYPKVAWDEVEKQYAAIPGSQRGAMRFFVGTADKCVPDSQGRIILSPKLRKYAQLNREVVIVGQIDRAEIWPAETWKPDEDENMVPEIMAAKMAEWGF